MSEQTDKVLAELIQKASDGIDAAVSFSQAQLPDVVYQLLLWNATASLMMQVFCVVFFITYAVGLRWAIPEASNSSSRYEMAAFFFVLIGAVSSPSLLFVFIFNFDWLKIWLAPKLYLIEYAAQFLK
ncbi:hypothetical protein GWD52_21095 [Enterobacteriaceae bacterium 4M9]|nr:hypothetical protein [Enterobacteriaceae bacterium 4M9]